MFWGCLVFFDYYSFSAADVAAGSVPDLISEMLCVLDGFGVRVCVGRGGYGYPLSSELLLGDECVARFYYSFVVPGVFGVVVGSLTPVLVERVRAVVPDHKVSRVDVASDFVGDFDAVSGLVDNLLGCSTRLVTNSDGGATKYFGSVKSDCLLRLYKKTEQMLLVHGVEMPPGVLRLEAQIRPKSLDKGSFSSWSPEQCLSFRRRSRQAFAAVAGLRDSGDRSSVHRRLGNWVRTLDWLERQGRSSAVGEVLARGGDVAGVREDVLRALGLDLD